MTNTLWCRFRIGDVFPTGSPLAKWIAGLTLIVNDLLQAYDAMQREFNGETESPEGLFYFWLTCAQFREAAKILNEGMKLPEIQTFVGTLEADDQTLLQVLRPSYEPWKGSFVEAIARPLRDHFFHYPKPSDEEWDSVLRDMADVESGVRIRGDMHVSDLRGIFADELRTALLIQHLGLTTDEIGGSMRQLADYVGPLVRFAHGCLGRYLLQFPTGTLNIE